MVKYIIGAIFLLFLTGYLYIIQVNSAELTRIGRENNTYHRTVSCILSVPLATRTPEYITRCYDRAEKVNDITVDRFYKK